MEEGSDTPTMTFPHLPPAILFFLGVLSAPAAADSLSVSAGAEVPTVTVAYARDLSTRLAVGGEVGYAYEEHGHDLDHNVFDAAHLGAFARYTVAPWAHVDLGTSVTHYASGDDGAPTGNFVAAQVAPAVGYRYVYLTWRVRAGVDFDADGNASAGVVHTPMATVVFRW